MHGRILTLEYASNRRRIGSSLATDLLNGPRFLKIAQKAAKHNQI